MTAWAASAHCDDGAFAGADVQQVEGRLQQLQEQFGPYSPALSEPTAELGLMLIRNGAHADARKAFRRAMQIERVNGGLYTPRQLPLLDMAIESSIAARDWGQVDDDFHYFEWLSYRIHGSRDPSLIDGLDRIISWHVAAVHLDAEAEKGRHLLRLLELGERRAELIERHYGSGHPRYLAAIYELALHFYYVNIAAQHPGPVAETLIEELASPMDYRRSALLARENLADHCYMKGRQLLEYAVESARDARAFTPEAGGAVLIYLADWELMFNHANRAEQLYEDAFETLVAAGVPANSLAHYFATPALLPEQRFRLGLESEDIGRAFADATGPQAIRFVPWAREVPGVQFPASGSPLPQAETRERYALARFHVEESGWAENIRIIEAQPDDKRLSRHARKALWYAQFRPRLEDGRVAVARDVEALYLPLE
jgi:hypothetical protein